MAMEKEMEREKELAALRAANFNWTLHLQSIWEDHAYHVDGIQPRITTEFSAKLSDLRQQTSTHSPLGWVLTGTGGAGKTHLLSRMRAEAIRQQCVFVLVDMTDVHDFWETVAIGYTSSLQEAYSGELTQSQFILRKLIGKISTPEKVADNLRAVVTADPKKLKRYSEKIIHEIARRPRHRGLAADHQDTIRALIASNSDHFEIANLGQVWLQGIELEPADKQLLGFQTQRRNPIHTVTGLSWIISLSTPSVLAFDQLDPIVRQLDFEAIQSGSENNASQEAVANSIISGIGDGLRALYDRTQRTLVVLACLESSWEILLNRVLQSSADRFPPPRQLESIQQADRLQAIVAARMSAACQRVGFDPPFASWPFHPDAFADQWAITPRELLKRCHRHQQDCLERGSVSLLRSLGEPRAAGPAGPSTESLAALDQRFDELRPSADLAQFLDEQNEDDLFASVLVSACESLSLEVPLPTGIHCVVDTQFTGGSNVKPLHARIRLIMHEEEEREEHFSVRVLQRGNAIAFQNRLKLAMTQSGIDQRISFRRLTLLRSKACPGGQKTQQLLAEFQKQGGQICSPTEEELRDLWALHGLLQERHEQFETWLRSRRPLSRMAWCQQAFAGLFERSQSTSQPVDPDADSSTHPELAAEVSPGEPVAPEPRQAEGAATEAEQRPVTSPLPETTPLPTDQKQPGGEPKHANLSDSRFPLGRRLIGKQVGEPLTLPLGTLDKHVVVRAGSGSGKTVLLKRMIEEAALREIPSIVLDAGNDMAALGDRWATAPDGWQASDPELAERYHRQTETIIWTPGRRSANPLRLELIPDLRATVDEPDEFDGAVAMVAAGLADVLGLRTTRGDENKKGILSRSLRFFVQQGLTGLDAFIELLSDLPAEARLGIGREDKLASDLADALRVLRETDPLISDDEGQPLDPAILFGDDRPRERTRISVVSLAFLPSDTERLRFVNKLALTLFAWIKANPNPPGRDLRGLLVLDEAKDLIPAQRSTPCKQSLMRLAAQARKYKLGVVFATQNPREIENTVVGNCSTQLFGKANSSTAIDTIRDLIAQMKGSAQDIGRLERGVFYAYNADIGMDAPAKITAPMCLSHHRPLAVEEVLARAVRGPDSNSSIPAAAGLTSVR